MTAASRLVATSKLFDRLAIEYLGKTNTSPFSSAVRDMRDYCGVAYIVGLISQNAGDDAITQVDIWASDDAAGSVNAVLVATTGTIDPDSLGDYVALEVSEDEIRQTSVNNGYASRYGICKVTTTSSSDVCAVIVIRGLAKAAHAEPHQQRADHDLSHVLARTIPPHAPRSDRGPPRGHQKPARPGTIRAGRCGFARPPAARTRPPPGTPPGSCTITRGTSRRTNTRPGCACRPSRSCSSGFAANAPTRSCSCARS